MSSEKNKSLGHNSFNIDDYKNGMEQIKNATAKLSEVWKRIRRASNYHIGSHGGDYYFADEQSNAKDCERYPATSPEFGLYRRPNPYEKKEFAGKTVDTLDNVIDDLHTIEVDIADSLKSMEGKNE